MTICEKVRRKELFKEYEEARSKMISVKSLRARKQIDKKIEETKNA